MTNMLENAQVSRRTFMKGSALAGLAALMGHRAATICTIIAQRIAQNVDTDYKPFVRKMISTALDKLAVLK